MEMIKTRIFPEKQLHLLISIYILSSFIAIIAIYNSAVRLPPTADIFKHWIVSDWLESKNKFI